MARTVTSWRRVNACSSTPWNTVHKAWTARRNTSKVRITNLATSFKHSRLRLLLSSQSYALSSTYSLKLGLRSERTIGLFTWSVIILNWKIWRHLLAMKSRLLSKTYWPHSNPSSCPPFNRWPTGSSIGRGKSQTSWRPNCWLWQAPRMRKW
jgi:hypothetical protein